MHAAPSPVELVGCLVVGRAGWDLCRGLHGQGCAGSILVGSAWSVGGQGWEGRRRPGPLTATVFVLPHLVPPQAPAREEESPETWPCLVQGWCKVPRAHVKDPPPNYCYDSNCTNDR